MRIRTSLVLAIMAAAILSVPSAEAHHRPGPCDLHQQPDESIRHFSTRRIVCAVEEFGPLRGGTERAVCIADRESGLDPKASSPTGMYLGLYQHAAEHWPVRYEGYTDPLWELSDSALRGRSNSIVTIRMVAEAGGWGAAGWPRGEC